jgi:hypothetical protein
VVPALSRYEKGESERDSFTLDLVMGCLYLVVARSLLAAASGTVVLLAPAACFHWLGRLRDRAAKAQQHRAGGIA